MRILFLARWYPSHDAPGRGSFVADQARALVNAGAEVVVASWEPALVGAVADADDLAETWARAIERSPLPLATPRSWGAGVPVARLPAVMPADPGDRHPVDLARWQATTALPFGRALAALWPFDAIHAHTGLPDGVAATAVADALGLPLVTTEHDGSLDVRLANERARAAYRTLVGAGRGLVAVSDRLADQMARLAGVDRARIAVIPNLVDRDVFRPDPDVRRDPDELLWVGSRKRSKGMVELVEAFALAAATRPGLHLRLIGAAPTAADDADLQSLAAGLGIASRVRFEPAASRTEVAAAMARAGLFVHPSPTESFGIVAVEALAAGLPIVAVAPTVVDRIGRDGRLGEAAAGPDADSLHAAIERALERLPSFDPEALRAATEPYGSEAVATALVGAYRAAGATDTAPGGGWSPSSSTVAATDGSAGTLVVGGRRRSAIDRVGALPPAGGTGLTVVTSTGADPLPVGADVTWIECDPDARWRAALERLGRPVGRSGRRSPARRLFEALLHPRRTMAGRRLYAGRARMALAALAEATAAAHARLGPGVPVVALDADDLLVIREAGLEDVLAPSILRGFADRGDGAGPVVGSGARAPWE